MGDAPMTDTRNCAICGAEAAPVGRVPGYRRPDTFTVMECRLCGASFSVPLAVDRSIYEAIYANRHRAQGYQRYEKIAAEVARQAEPLQWLANQDAIYWAVADAVKDLPRGARMLEVGSGLGYTTHALASAGFDAVGLDLSREAVSHANRRYGERYVVGDVTELSEHDHGTFDAIVATELIEHVVDPVAFVDRIRDLLRPGGRIILTTPDKGIYRPGTLWQSDLPPVHLWWFTESSMRALATRIGLEVEFTDFSEYHRAHPDAVRVAWPDGEVLPEPRLLEDGTPVQEGVPRGATRYFHGNPRGIRNRLLWIAYQLKPRRKLRLGRRSRTLGLVLRGTARQ